MIVGNKYDLKQQPPWIQTLSLSTDWLICLWITWRTPCHILSQIRQWSVPAFPLFMWWIWFSCTCYYFCISLKSRGKAFLFCRIIELRLFSHAFYSSLWKRSQVHRLNAWVIHRAPFPAHFSAPGNKSHLSLVSEVEKLTVPFRMKGGFCSYFITYD